MSQLNSTTVLAAVLVLVGAAMLVAELLSGVVLVVGGAVLIAREWIS